MAMENLGEVAPAAIGAAAGGGGVLWLAKMLLTRLLTQFDKKHDDHEDKLEKLSEKLAESQLQVAVLNAMFAEAKQLRVEVSEKMNRMQGEIEAKYLALTSEVKELRVDTFVAHERVRLLASGDLDISKVQKPDHITKRV